MLEYVYEDFELAMEEIEKRVLYAYVTLLCAMSMRNANTSTLRRKTTN